MLEWAFIFLIIALVAGALGFTGLARGAASIAIILFWVFLAIFVVLLILALLGVAAVGELENAGYWAVLGASRERVFFGRLVVDRSTAADVVKAANTARTKAQTKPMVSTVTATTKKNATNDVSEIATPRASWARATQPHWECVKTPMTENMTG
nr:MAG: hypothetical protein DIU57_09000 [Pseudomonadota bacterium]